MVLFSSGSFGQNIYKNSKSTGSIKICCWIDEDFKRASFGLPVLGIKSVHEIDYEYIFIATLDPDILSIAKIMLKQMKVPPRRLYIFITMKILKINT